MATVRIIVASGLGDVEVTVESGPAGPGHAKPALTQALADAMAKVCRAYEIEPVG